MFYISYKEKKERKDHRYIHISRIIKSVCLSVCLSVSQSTEYLSVNLVNQVVKDFPPFFFKWMGAKCDRFEEIFFFFCESFCDRLDVVMYVCTVQGEEDGLSKSIYVCIVHTDTNKALL